MIRLVRALAAAFAFAFLVAAMPTAASAQLLSLDLDIDLSVGDLLSDLLPDLDLPDVDINLNLPGVDIGVGVSLDGDPPGVPPPPGGGNAPQNLPAANGVVAMPQVLQAVADARALPLNDLLRIVARYFDGQVIDVALVLVQNSLYYQVKLLSTGGVVFQQYFEAATGTPVAF